MYTVRYAVHYICGEAVTILYRDIPVLEQRQRVMQPSELVRLHLGRQRAPDTRAHTYSPDAQHGDLFVCPYGDMPDAQRPHAVP